MNYEKKTDCLGYIEIILPNYIGIISKNNIIISIPIKGVFCGSNGSSIFHESSQG